MHKNDIWPFLPFLAISSHLKWAKNRKWYKYLFNTNLFWPRIGVIIGDISFLCIKVAFWPFLAILPISSHLELTKNENMSFLDLLWSILRSFSQYISFLSLFFHIRLLNTLSVIKKCYVKCAPVEAAQCSSSVCMIDATEHHTLHEHIECRC